MDRLGVVAPCDGDGMPTYRQLYPGIPTAKINLP